MTTPPGPLLASGATPVTCPHCGAAATSRFCTVCGTPVGGTRCANCEALLSTGARFCHRCGTAAGTGPVPRAGAPRGVIVPWIVAAAALVALAISLAARPGTTRLNARDVARPTQLLGVVLATGAAAALGDAAALRQLNKRLVDAAPRELAAPLDEYLPHRPVTDNALRTARTTP